jgi:hypothetical protein
MCGLRSQRRTCRCTRKRRRDRCIVAGRCGQETQGASSSARNFYASLHFIIAVELLREPSWILVAGKDRTEELRQQGKGAWEAVLEATQHRTRPILLTAAAASLALIPISREVFWGPMAYALMGGIIVGTLLTLVFLPALYVAWFRVKAPTSPDDARTAAE